MIAARVFAVLAAAFGVAAIALASLSPPGMTLAQALGLWDDKALTWLQKHSLEWAWVFVEQPMLLRPLWLGPAMLALVCGGLSLSFNFGAAGASHRRRS